MCERVNRLPSSPLRHRTLRRTLSDLGGRSSRVNEFRTGSTFLESLRPSIRKVSRGPSELVRTVVGGNDLAEAVEGLALAAHGQVSLRGQGGPEKECVGRSVDVVAAACAHRPEYWGLGRRIQAVRRVWPPLTERLRRHGSILSDHGTTQPSSYRPKPAIPAPKDPRPARASFSALGRPYPRPRRRALGAELGPEPSQLTASPTRSQPGLFVESRGPRRRCRIQKAQSRGSQSSSGVAEKSCVRPKPLGPHRPGPLKI